jgi:hypothetical protein
LRPAHGVAGETRQALLFKEAPDELVGASPRVQHSAVRGKGTGGRIVRALVEDDGPVETADDLPKVDLLGRSSKSDPSADAPPSGDEACAVELCDDTASERIRDEEVFAQAAGRDTLTDRPASQLRQDADSIVGASREFRGSLLLSSRR